MLNVPESMLKRLEALAAVARARNVVWEADAKRLPPGDAVAQIGLLAHRLGIPFSVALDEGLSELELRSFVTQEM